MLTYKDDEFFAAVGRTIAAWSALENLLCQWFVNLLDGHRNGTHIALQKVFNSGKNFNTKKDLLHAVVLELPDDALKAFLNKGIEKAAQYSGFRNRVAHDFYVGALNGDDYVMQIRKQKDIYSQEQSITLEGLKAAQQRIGKLNLLFLLVMSKMKTPEEAIVELSQLPKVADFAFDAK